LRPVYEALLQVHAGGRLDPALISILQERHADNPEANYMVSVALAKEGKRLDAAREHAEFAVSAEPWNPHYRHQLALTLMRLDDLPLAEAELRHAIELDRSVDWWKYQLAQVQFRQRKYGFCRDLLKEYLERRPHSADGWQLLGRCCEAFDAVEEAAEAFRRAADAKPAWAWPLLKLANLRLRSRTRPDEGLAATDRLLDIVLDTRPKAEIHLLRTQFYETEGRLETAIEAANRSVELCPDWDWARTVQARLVALEARRPGGTAARTSKMAAPSGEHSIGGLKSTPAMRSKDVVHPADR
jgi:tetratricopeptide (TPR) repeat protein